MKTKILALALFAATAAIVGFYPYLTSHAKGVGPSNPMGPIPVNHLVQRPKIEVVFALDTTGSMSGLIQAAKDKIWSIASTMASAQQAPEIRMGLVAYRDRGDQYVTRVVDLSDDLDSMYAALIDFQAEGGGDGPESVNQALNDAIHKMSWSQDPNAYRVVFLVGDAPPHMDYNEVQYPATLRTARERGIVVNTIRCGNDPATQNQWQRIAALSQGQYFSVGQGGDAIAMTTPFDTKIAKLAASLDDTRLYFGSEEVRAEKQKKLDATDKLHAKASPAAQARRAAFNMSKSGESNLFGEDDLVAAVADGRVDLNELDEDLLPEPLVDMAPEERIAAVGIAVQQRDDLKRQIQELTVERDNYLTSEVEASGEKEESLDHQLYDAVRAQASKKGFEYTAAPKY